MTRYHPLLVALHWIMAIMVLMALIFGKFALAPADNADPQKLVGLTGHMSVGIMLGVLLIIRLVLRVTSEKPPHVETGNSLIDKAGVLAHWALYLLVALMVLSGIGTAVTGDLFAIVFGQSGDPIPSNLSELPPRLAHGVISNLLILLLALHIVAALYHQFVLKDNLFHRVWFGKRN